MTFDPSVINRINSMLKNGKDIINNGNLVQGLKIYSQIPDIPIQVVHSLNQEDLGFMRMACLNISTHNPKNNELMMLIILILKKFYMKEECVEVAKNTLNVDPMGMAPFFLAISYRALGKYDDAINVLRGALKLKPDNYTFLQDIGEILCYQGKFEEGMKEYQEFLKIEPNHDKVKSHYLFINYFLTRDNNFKNQLFEFARASQANKIANELAKKLNIFTTYLPEPQDSVINLCRDFSQHESRDIKSLDIPRMGVNLLKLQVQC